MEIFMYFVLGAFAAIFGALTTIILMNLYRKSKPFAAAFTVLVVLSIIYQFYTFVELSLYLALSVLAIYIFFAVAGLMTMKKSSSEQ